LNSDPRSIADDDLRRPGPRPAARPVKRRRFLSVGGAGVLLATLIGCERSSPAPAVSSTPSADAPAAAIAANQGPITPVQMNVMGWPYRQDLFENVLDRFRRLNPDVEVAFREVLNDYGPRVEAAILGDAPSNVVLVRESQAGAWWASSLLRPLSGLASFGQAADKLFPGARGGVSANGELAGLPFYSDAIVLAYNAATLDAIGAGPPTTWDELLAQAQTIRDRGLSRWPLSLNLSPKLNANLPWWAMVYAAGGSLRTEGDDLYNADPADPTPRLLRMLHSYLVDDLILDPDFGESSYSEILDGGPAFALVGTYFARVAATVRNQRGTPPIGFAPVPGLDGPGVATAGWTPFYAVPATAPEPDTSALLALHLGGIDGTGEFFAPRFWAMNEGLPPAYPAILEDSEVRARFAEWIEPDLLKSVLGAAKPVEALWEPWYDTWEHWMQDEVLAAIWGRKTDIEATDSINRYAHGLSGRTEFGG
jgi:multiple sugar transport system substrate-binding protein